MCVRVCLKAQSVAVECDATVQKKNPDFHRLCKVELWRRVKLHTAKYATVAFEKVTRTKFIMGKKSQLAF